jgi:hypothetical protein
MILDERAFTSNLGGTRLDTGRNENCCSAGAWWQPVQTYVTMQRDRGKGLVLINYDNTPELTISDFVTDTNATARANLQWVLANYPTPAVRPHLSRVGESRQDRVSAREPARVRNRRGDRYGHGRLPLAQGVFVRDFTNGFAIVNPNPGESYTVTVGSGYKNLYGNALNSITMKPDSDAVLLKR